jgi:hypothetical protein
MKNYEIYLIRNGEPIGDYPNVGRVYTSPHSDCVKSAQIFYPGHTLHTALSFRGHEKDETNEAFALRCVAGLNQLFSDLTRSGLAKAALVTDDEVIVTLMSGCGLPKGEPTDFVLQSGEGWLIRMTAYLWQKGYAFEVVGKLSL